MDYVVLRIPGRPVRGQPDPDRDPHVSRRPRRRTRGHLRRPLARPDCGARRDDGAAVAVLGRRSSRPGVYWISLGFTFIGAAVFASIHRDNTARIPQEAIIGICYAVASAGAIVTMSKSTRRPSTCKDMLVGNILAVSWHEVVKTALLYGAIGTVPLRLPATLSGDLDGRRAVAEAEGISIRLLGFPLLCVVRLRRDIVGVDRRRAAGILLSDRPVGRGDAVRRANRPTAGDRLDRWAHSSRRSGSVCHSSWICRPGRRSS